jgi:hypothetical protein
MTDFEGLTEEERNAERTIVPLIEMLGGTASRATLIHITSGVTGADPKNINITIDSRRARGTLSDHIEGVLRLNPEAVEEMDPVMLSEDERTALDSL